MSDPIKVGITYSGHEIWKVPNLLVGGYDYISDECYQKLDVAMWDINALEIVMKDLKKKRDSFPRRFIQWMRYPMKKKLFQLKVFLRVIK